MLRHKLFSHVLFNTRIILITRWSDYSSIHYSNLLRHYRIRYFHKSGTGHNYKKRQNILISFIPGCLSYDRYILVHNHLPHPPALDKASEKLQFLVNIRNMLCTCRSLQEAQWGMLSMINYPRAQLRIPILMVMDFLLPSLQGGILPLWTIPQA